MSCEIKILSVIPYGASGQPVSSVEVKGSATQCDAVVVSITCGGAERTDSVSVNAQGQWQTTFVNLNDSHCLCGDPNTALVVVAFCKADPTCSDREILQPIPCQPYPCPTIDHIDTQIPVCAQVTQAGAYVVTFTAVINGTGVTNYVWTFGDGQTLTGPNLQQVTHAYPCAGTYVVTLVILSDCQPNYVNVSTAALVLPPCGCPTVQIVAESAASNPCKWTFKASLSGPFVQCIDSYLWNFGDGTQLTTSVPGAEHTYTQNGTRNVTLTLLGDLGQAGGGACYVSTEINVTNCRGGGNGGDGGHPCPWWNPFCHGWSFCAALLSLAIAALIAAGFLLMFGICGENPALTAIGGAAAAAGFGFLVAWYFACARIKADFCETLESLIVTFAYIVAVQGIVLLILSALGIVPVCYALVTFAYYGTVLAYLTLIKQWAHCP